MNDMVHLQIILRLTFETMGEGVNLHLKKIFQS